MQKIRLEKQDYLTIFIFLAGFLFTAVDSKLLNFMQLLVQIMSPSFRISSYIFALLFLLTITILYIKRTQFFRITKEMLYNIKPENNPKYKETRFALALKVFEIFSLAALVGFLVLSLNAYTIVGFNLLAQP